MRWRRRWRSSRPSTVTTGQGQRSGGPDRDQCRGRRLRGDDCFGTPVIEAARLCAAAAGGQILASEMVRWLARPEVIRPSPRSARLELKGLPEPVPTCQVDWEPLPGSAVPLPPLPDRHRADLRRPGRRAGAARAAVEGSGGRRAAGGAAGRRAGRGQDPPGRRARRPGPRRRGDVLAGRCDEDLGVPYQPFVEALRHFVDHAPLSAGTAGPLRRGAGPARPRAGRAGPGPARRRSGPTRRPSATGSSTPWPPGWRPPPPRSPSCSSSTTCSGRPSRRCCCCATSSAPPERGGSWSSAPTGTPSSTHDHPLVELLADLRRRGGRRAALAVRARRRRGGEPSWSRPPATTSTTTASPWPGRSTHETEGNPFFVREVLRHLAETGAIDGATGALDHPAARRRARDPRGCAGRRGPAAVPPVGRGQPGPAVAAVVGPEFELGVVRRGRRRRRGRRCSPPWRRRSPPGW